MALRKDTPSQYRQSYSSVVQGATYIPECPLNNYVPKIHSVWDTLISKFRFNKGGISFSSMYIVTKIIRFVRK